MSFKSEVNYVSMTEPAPRLKGVGINTPEQYLAYIARVSNPINQVANETAPKLLNYCLINYHWSVFEQVDITYEIRTTRDIGRQILRHRSAVFQEFSQRYAKVDLDTSVNKAARLQDVKNRQSSIILDPSYKGHELLDAEWTAKQKEVLEKISEVYGWALEAGIAKEVARVVLPEGLTPSTMYMKNNLRNWITYCDLRTGNGTQLEHREIAEMISKDLADRFEFYALYLNNKKQLTPEQKEIASLKMQIADLESELREMTSEIRILNRHIGD